MSNRSSDRHLQSPIYILLLCLLIVRLLPVALITVTKGAPPDVFYKDHYIYLWGAENIIKTGVNPFDFFPPLNSLFIAGILWFTGGSVLAALAAMAIVGWLTIVLVFLMAQRLFDHKTAVCAAVLCGLYPNFIAYGATFCTETLGTFWVCFAFLLLIQYRSTERKRYLLLCAIIWGVAAQTRGGLHYFAPFFIAGLFLVRSKKRVLLARDSLLFLAAIWCTLYAIGRLTAPVQNGDIMNPKSGIASVVHGANRMTTSCADYGDIRGNIFYYINDTPEPWPEGSQLCSEELMSLPTSRILLKTASFILEQPFVYVKNSLLKLSCFWSPNQLVIAAIKLKLQRYNLLANGISLCIALLYLVLMVGAILGLATSKDVLKPFFVLFIVFYNFLIFFTVGNSKLRLPLMPIFIMYGACFFVSLRTQKGLFLNMVSKTWLLVPALLILINGIYRFAEILPAPAETYVRQVELCNRLGFPKTAARLIKQYQAMPYYNDNQKNRLRVEYERSLHTHRQKTHKTP